jgi:adenosylhomocysteine nucleosidase
MWGVIAAVPPELRATLRALRARPLRAGRLSVHAWGEGLFTCGGIGAARAESCAIELIERFHPDTLVSTGFAAALAEELETGTVVLGGTASHPASEAALRRARAAAPAARLGPIAAVERVLLEPEEKRRVAARTGAIAADMESEAIGRLARARGLSFLCVKVILDTPSRPLACRYESVAGVIAAILRRPAVLPRIVADARRAREAARRLAEFYRGLAAPGAG